MNVYIERNARILFIFRYIDVLRIIYERYYPRDGRIIEPIGTYDPVAKSGSIVKIDEELALKWLKNGAQPTETTKALLQQVGVIEVKGNTLNYQQVFFSIRY